MQAGYGAGEILQQKGISRMRTPKTPLQAGETVIADKISNAQIVSARPSALFDEIAGAVGSAGAARGVAKLAGKMMGGLWVGGRCYLTSHRVLFEPNSLNRALHDGIAAVALPLTGMQAVGVRWGLFTSIVDFQTENGRLSIRCYGAKDFAALTRETAGLSD